MERILVTGCRGFIGTHLVRLLLQGTNRRVLGLSRFNRDCQVMAVNGKRNIEYVEVKCDICDEVSLKIALDDFAPEVIFHLAANPLVRLGPEDPQGSKMWKTNVEGTRFLLAHAPESCRFVFASSATVYGDRTSLWCYESNPTRPTSLYGAAKLASETLVSTYTRMGKVRGVSLRYVANVGPNATHGVVRDLLNKLRSDSPTLDLLGDKPGSVKPYMHVSDTAAATMLVGMSQYEWPVNVSPADTLSIETLAEVVMEASGIRKPVRWLGKAANWKGDNPFVEVSPALLFNTFGFMSSYPTSAAAVARAVKEMCLSCPKVE